MGGHLAHPTEFLRECDRVGIANKNCFKLVARYPPDYFLLPPTAKTLSSINLVKEDIVFIKKCDSSIYKYS